MKPRRADSGPLESVAEEAVKVVAKGKQPWAWLIAVFLLGGSLADRVRAWIDTPSVPQMQAAITAAVAPVVAAVDELKQGHKEILARLDAKKGQ